MSWKYSFDQRRQNKILRLFLVHNIYETHMENKLGNQVGHVKHTKHIDKTNKSWSESSIILSM